VLRLGLTLLLAGLSGAAAFASETSKAAFELYRTGKYEAAIMAGEAAGDGESLAVAARAAFAEANLGETPCLPCLQRVERLARHSIALDAAHPEAFVYLAAALGYQARIVGNVRAQFSRYPEQAKEAIDKALSVAPDDAWSLASAGAWHIEVVRNAGSVLARALYGARADLGKDYFHRAFAADPGNLVIRFQYALTLSGYDLEANKSEAMTALAAAVSSEPRTVYEGAIKQRAARLLDLIKANRRADYLALVSRYQGYSG
jgi:tetratricopeptide (TPR) repeat protein